MSNFLIYSVVHHKKKSLKKTYDTLWGCFYVEFLGRWHHLFFFICIFHISYFWYLWWSKQCEFSKTARKESMDEHI